jgi:hypothetical protein
MHRHICCYEHIPPVDLRVLSSASLFQIANERAEAEKMWEGEKMDSSGSEEEDPRFGTIQCDVVVDKQAYYVDAVNVYHFGHLWHDNVLALYGTIFDNNTPASILHDSFTPEGDPQQAGPERATSKEEEDGYTEDYYTDDVQIITSILPPVHRAIGKFNDVLGGLSRWRIWRCIRGAEGREGVVVCLQARGYSCTGGEKRRGRYQCRRKACSSPPFPCSARSVFPVSLLSSPSFAHSSVL